MQGLEIDLIDAGATPGLTPLVVTITSDHWRLMNGLHVGQRVSEVAALYGAVLKKGDERLTVCGEAVCLQVEHHAERVTKLHLDCQAST